MFRKAALEMPPQMDIQGTPQKGVDSRAYNRQGEGVGAEMNVFSE
jgi:hypothetical protein